MIELLLQADRLLTVDMVDQAEAIYRKVAEQDPRNAIAVVGLARCALARGDDHEAYRLAARAHDIDPADDMARRMTLRMAEVLAYRGETVAPIDPAPRIAPAAETAASAAPNAPATPTSPSPSRSWLDRVRGR